MKKYFKYLFIVLAVMVFQTSCDDGFDELNVNPTAANDINPRFQFSLVQLQTSGARYENWRAVLIYTSVMIQHFATTCGYWSGDKYTYNSSYASSLFDATYGEEVKNIQDLINTLQTTESGDATMLAQARIMRALIFQRLTDMYGDIPYFDAGKGFLEGIDFPAYDKQSEIYPDMLKELEEAAANLGSGGFGSADFFYGGDVDKWRKFAYSLMLRMGMRLTEVDPAAAESWVKKAIAGGVMEDFSDNAFIVHPAGPEGLNRNGIGEVLDLVSGSGNDDCPRLSNTLVDKLKATNDPRLDILGVLPANGGTEHNGLPNGLDSENILNNPTGTSVDDFDRINPKLVTITSPMLFMTYAEVELLLAEAALRNWGASDAESHYNAGVRAAMKIYELFDATLAVDDATIDAYLSSNPFDNSKGFEQIGEQYWLATIFNEYEAFANWRRTGYPNLTPVNHPTSVTGGQIPLRLVYPQGEAGGNPDNFAAALAQQGMSSDFSSHLTVPVWWDK